MRKEEVCFRSVYLRLIPILRIMKITFLLVILVITQLEASTFAQNVKVDINMKNASLREVFEELKQKYGFSFMCSNDDIQTIAKKDIRMKNSDIESVLNKCLEGTNLTYELIDNVVIIRKIPFAAQDSVKSLTVTGTVKDESGAYLPGVTVQVKELKLGTATNIEGQYKLTIPNLKTFTLVYSFVGMVTQEIKYAGKDSVNVTMKEDVKSVDEVIVTGYQKINPRHNTSAVQSIKMDDIIVPGVNTIDRLLEGNVPGLIFMQNSGQVGAAPRLRIRGNSTILGTQEPLWVVDGIIQQDPVNIEPNELNNLDFVNLLGNAISGLNPEDISQIDILKDASATAIYGARAANGVIVVTTKKGRVGPPSVTYSATGTFSRRPRYTDREVNVMNSKERVAISRELMEKGRTFRSTGFVSYESALSDYSNGKIDFEEFQRLSNWYQNVNTDWFDILCRDAFSHKHTLSFSGGSSTIRYYASVSMNDEKDVIKDSGIKLYTASLNVSAEHKGLRVSLDMKGNSSKKKYTPTDMNILNYAYTTSRSIPCYNKDGSLLYYDYAGNHYISSEVTWATVTNFNVINEMNNSGYDVNTTNLTATANVAYKLRDWLDLNAILSYSTGNTEEETWYNENTYHVSLLRGGQWNPNTCPVGGEFISKSTRSNSYTARFQVDVNKYFGEDEKHLLNTSIGVEASSSKYKGINQTIRGYIRDRGNAVSEIDLDANAAYKTWLQTEGRPKLTGTLTNMMSAYFTATYGYKDTYFINFNTRLDASNSFGDRSNEKLFPIWSVSGRWNIVNDLLKNADWVNNLSLRGSYGLQGNMIPGQTSDMIMKMGNYNEAYGGYESTVSYFPNPNLKWEKTASSNVTVEFSFLDNKLKGTFSYYHKKTSDAFLNKIVSPINGVTDYVINKGTLTNQGVEIALSFSPVNRLTTVDGKRKGFNWRFDPELGQVLNKLVNKAINDKQNALTNEVSYKDFLNGTATVSGKALNTFYSYKFAGLSEIGEPTFYGTEDKYRNDWEDENGNTVKGYQTKYANMDIQDVYMEVMESSGRREPYLQGGISNHFEYGNFSLSVRLTYSIGNKLRLLNLCSGYATSILQPTDNLRKEWVNRWQYPGDEAHTNIPELRKNYGSNPWWSRMDYKFAENMYQMYDNSDIRVVSGDYLKIASIALRYRIPEHFCQRLGLKSGSINLAGTNLHTFANKKLKGQSPTQWGGTDGINLSLRPTYSCNLIITF